MNVLITGVNGFIGSHVCRYFREKGHYVIGLDLGETAKNEMEEYLCCDMKTPAIGSVCERIKADHIEALIHLAADMRHEPYTVEVVGNNCIGIQRLLELCEAEKIPSFVQLSSLPVIGKPVEHPITERHPLKPPTVYHATKITQELLANYAFYSFGLRTVSFRICAPVGIGMNPRTIFPVFVGNALAGKNIVLFGKGSRQQTYIHVRDIARGIEKAIFSNAQGVYNMGSNNLISNRDLAEKCVALTGSSSKIVFSGTEDPMDQDVWDMSLAKARDDMGFEAVVPIEDAILEYTEELKKLR